MNLSLQPKGTAGDSAPDSVFRYSNAEDIYCRHCTSPIMVSVVTGGGRDQKANVYSVFTPYSVYNGRLRDIIGLSPSNLHKNDFFIFTYIQKGRAHLEIDGVKRELRSGDCYLLGRNVLYKSFLEKGGVCLSVLLTIDFFDMYSRLAAASIFPEDMKHLTTNPYWLFIRDNYPAVRKWEKRMKRDQSFSSGRHRQIDTALLARQAKEASKDARRAVRLEIESVFEGMFHDMLFPQPGGIFTIIAGLMKLFTAFADPDMYDYDRIASCAKSEIGIYLRIMQLLEMSNGCITSHEIARILNYNASYLNNIFRQHSGETINDYRTFCRMKKAAQLLEETQTSVSEIASSMQFTNRTLFYRQFRKYYDVTPAQYRKDARERRKAAAEGEDSGQTVR